MRCMQPGDGHTNAICTLCGAVAFQNAIVSHDKMAEFNARCTYIVYATDDYGNSSKYPANGMDCIASNLNIEMHFDHCCCRHRQFSENPTFNCTTCAYIRMPSIKFNEFKMQTDSISAHNNVTTNICSTSIVFDAVAAVATPSHHSVFTHEKWFL